MLQYKRERKNTVCDNYGKERSTYVLDNTRYASSEKECEKHFGHTILCRWPYKNMGKLSPVMKPLKRIIRLGPTKRTYKNHRDTAILGPIYACYLTPLEYPKAMQADDKKGVH